VNGVNNDVRQLKYTAEPSVPEPSCSEVVIALKSLKDFNVMGVIKLKQSLSKQEVAEGKYYVLRSRNILIFLGIKFKNCQAIEEINY
jgi:hypothetical protein